MAYFKKEEEEACFEVEGKMVLNMDYLFPQKADLVEALLSPYFALSVVEISVIILAW